MFAYFPNTHMDKQKVKILTVLAMLFTCTASALGYSVGLRQKEKQWCQRYQGTENLQECRGLPFGPL